MDDQVDRDSLTEEKASLVLERATQIEVTGAGEIGIEELRRAALDAGIDPAAFDRALAEVRGSEKRTVVPTGAAAGSSLPSLPLSGLGAFARAGALGLVGSTLAAFAHGLYEIFGIDLEVAAVFSLLLALFLVIGLAVDAVKKRGVRSFLTDLVPLWVGLTLVFMIGSAPDALEVLATMGAAGLTTGAIGSVLVALARALSRPSLPSGEGVPVLEERSED